MPSPPSSVARNRWARKSGTSWMNRTVRTRPRPLSLPLAAAPQVQAFVDSLSIRVIGEPAVSGLQWFIAVCSLQLRWFVGIYIAVTEYCVKKKKNATKTSQYSVTALTSLILVLIALVALNSMWIRLALNLPCFLLHRSPNTGIQSCADHTWLYYFEKYFMIYVFQGLFFFLCGGCEIAQCLVF